MITCALVPLTPNAETPARRGRSPAGHGAGPVSSRTSPADQSTCVDGGSAYRLSGSSPCRIDCTVLITPAMPAAAWVCPMLPFTELSQSGCPPVRSCP